MSDSSSYESDSSTESSSSEEEQQQQISKPIFISKSQRNQQSQTISKDEEKIDQDERKKQSTYSKLDSINNKYLDDSINPNDDTESFDGIDDTDDIEPEIEFENWKQRELFRFQRDQQLIEQIEKEKEEFMKRDQNR